MENKEALDELVGKLAEVRLQLDAIQSKIDELLRKDAGDGPESGSIDMDHEDYLSGISEETVQVPVAQEEPLQEATAVEEPAAMQEPEIPSQSGSDGSDSLFDSYVEAKPKAHRRYDKAQATKVVMDMKPEKPEWYAALPGPEVKDIRSAISLNDRVMFITSLFREDSMLFQDVVSRINAMGSMDKAVEYLSATFPEWDMYSDMVFRFMMAVRRKLR